jgi:hypothetical protein
VDQTILTISNAYVIPVILKKLNPTKRNIPMADGRMLAKKISLNEAVASLENDTHRLLFTWGLSHLDIEGRISGSPKVFRAIVIPLLEHITQDDVQKFFNDAVKHSLITRYQVNDQWFVQYPQFKNNQRLNPEREAPSKIPSPEGAVSDKKVFGQYGWYGAGWPEMKKNIRERDKICRICKKTPKANKRALEIHHLKSFKEFEGDFQEANKPNNLVALCHSCHLRIRNMSEGQVRTQCGLNDNSMSTQGGLTENSSLSLSLSSSQEKLSLSLREDKSPRKPKKSETSLPDDFGISEEVRKWAAGKGFIRLEEHLESFKDYALSRGKTYADWDAAFKRAIRENWAKLGGNGQLISKPQPQTNKADQVTAGNLAARERVLKKYQETGE